MKPAVGAADIEKVHARVRVLKELVDESLYVVDERALANAVLARATVRRAVADAHLRSERSDLPVRSFRRTRQARSFRLTNGAPGAALHHR